MGKIKTPEWVPEVVWRFANYLFANAPDMPQEVEAVLIRLVTDHRMKAVWEEIGKRRRINYKSTVELFYTAKLPLEIKGWPALAATWRQEAEQMRNSGNVKGGQLFQRWSEALASPLPAEECGTEDDASLAMAVLLGLAVGHFGAGFRTVRTVAFTELLTRLRANGKADIADAWAERAAQIEIGPFLVIRQRTDARIEAFVKGLGATTRAIFGSPLYGVLAVLTNVAFNGVGQTGEDFDQQRIRALLR